MLGLLAAATILSSYLSCAHGNEVYLSSIKIFKAHDKLVPPTIYFKCEDDNRGKMFLPDVKSTNHSYTVAQESVALTHIPKNGCQGDCGIYDQDWFNPDDLFGSVFKICDADFDQQTKTHTVEVPGEVHLELYCPQCNIYVAPPPPPPPPPTGTDASAAGGAAFSTAPGPGSTASGGNREEKLDRIMIVLVFAAVFMGFLLGFVVHRFWRACKDVEAEESRRRFQSLYADPHTEIEDLPTHIPGHTQGSFDKIARSVRGIWRKEGSPQARPVVPLQQLKVSEEEEEVHDES